MTKPIQIRLHYSDSMDLLNALEKIAAALIALDIEMEILDGGDGFEEVSIRKITKDSNQKT